MTAKPQFLGHIVQLCIIDLYKRAADLFLHLLRRSVSFSTYVAQNASICCISCTCGHSVPFWYSICPKIHIIASSSFLKSWNVGISISQSFRDSRRLYRISERIHHTGWKTARRRQGLHGENEYAIQFCPTCRISSCCRVHHYSLPHKL